MQKVTAEYVRSILRYEPETGTFVWRRRSDVRERWNTRYAGKQAGSVVGRYVSIRIGKRPYMAHRVAWLYMTGRWPEEFIDHKDRNGLNNRWCNLRAANKSQNEANRGAQSNNTSGHKGVSRHGTNKWRAQIKVGGRYQYLGSFECPVVAAKAYKRAAEAHFGEFASIR